MSADQWNTAHHITGLPRVTSLPADSEYLTWTAYVAVPGQSQVQVFTTYSGCQQPAATQVEESGNLIEVGVQSKKTQPGTMCPAIAQNSIVVIDLAGPVGDHQKPVPYNSVGH